MIRFVKIVVSFLFVSAFFIGMCRIVFAEDGCTGIEITEIMFDPAGSDTDREWIELYNSTDNDIIIDSSWRIFDGSNHTITGGAGTNIPAKSFLIISSDPGVFLSEYQGVSGLVLKSALSLNNTGERVEVRYNTTMCFGVDYIVPSGTESGYTYEKKDTVWGIGGVLGGTPLKGYDSSNNGDGGGGDDEIISETGVPPQQTISQKTTEWQLNNLVHFNEIYFSDNDSWIELVNGSTSSINLSGWKFRAGANEYTINENDFPNTILKNGEYLLVPIGVSGIRKNQASGVIELFNSKNELVEKINYGAYKEGNTYGIIDERWKWFDNPTKGRQNIIKDIVTDVSVLDKMQSVDKYKTIHITEIFPNPKGSDDAEWVEIYNSGEADVSLDELFIDDTDGGSKPYSLSGITILAGDYIIIKKEDSKINFNNTSDEARILFGKDTLITKVSYSGAKENNCYSSVSDKWIWTTDCTLGEENSLVYDEKTTENKEELTEYETDFQTNNPTSALVSGDGLMCFDGVVTLPYGTIWKTKMFVLTDNEGVIEGRISKKISVNIQVGDNVVLCGAVKTQNGVDYISVSSLDVKQGGKIDYDKILFDDIENIEAGTPVNIEGNLKTLSKKSLTLVNEDGSKTVRVTGDDLSFDKKDFLKGQPVIVSGIFIKKGSSEYINVFSSSDVKQGTVVHGDADKEGVLIGDENEKNKNNHIMNEEPVKQKKRSFVGAIAPWGLAVALGGYLVRLRFFV